MAVVDADEWIIADGMPGGGAVRTDRQYEQNTSGGLPSRPVAVKPLANRRRWS